jgi:hypothetical protein
MAYACPSIATFTAPMEFSSKQAFRAVNRSGRSRVSDLDRSTDHRVPARSTLHPYPANASQMQSASRFLIVVI